MKYAIAIIIMTLIIFIFFAAHFLIYKSAIKFFLLESRKIKNFLILSLFFLAVSPIAAAVLTRFYGNSLTGFFYFAANLWWGIAINLLLAAILGWLALFLAKSIGWQFNLKIAGLLICAFAAAASLYGLLNARSLSIKEIEAPIKNLPHFWEGKTAVQITDLHLGAIYGENYLDKTIKLINEINPEIIFITGDYFDGTCPYLDRFVAPLNQLNPPQGVYFVYGNHETYEGKTRVAQALANSKVILLADEIAEVAGLQLIGLDYLSDGLKRDTAIFERAHPDKPAVLLYHQPTLTREAKAAGIDFQLSGHAHRGQFFPINFISRLVYGKYFYGFHQDGDYAIYTSSGTATWGPPLRTSGRNEIVAIKFKNR